MELETYIKLNVPLNYQKIELDWAFKRTEKEKEKIMKALLKLKGG